MSGVGVMCISGVSAEVQALTRAALQKSALWLAYQQESAGGDAQGAALLLFGMGCALGALDPSERPAECLTAVESLTHEVADAWRSRQSNLTKDVWIGSFVTPMMAAGSLRGLGKASAEALGATLDVVWHTSEVKGWLEEDPTLLWSGKRLVHLLSGHSRDGWSRVWWRSQISELVSPYAADAACIRQVCVDLAALSAYGQLAPPLPASEKDYLEKALPFWLFCYVKDQDLDMVCPLLRGLHYMGVQSNPEFQDAIGFVLRRSSADGRFTMREAAVHLHSSDGRHGDQVSRLIYLPLTVASVWALVESVFPSNAPFRLNSHA
jgi:hypothetical protein